MEPDDVLSALSQAQGGDGIDSAAGRESGGVKELSGMVCEISWE